MAEYPTHYCRWPLPTAETQRHRDPKVALCLCIPVVRLSFIFLVGVVDGEGAEILYQVQQVLIVLIPLGGDLEEEHDALMRPSELDEAGLADVIAQPARFFQV